MKEIALVGLALFYASSLFIAIRHLVSKHLWDRLFGFMILCITMYLLLGNIISP